MYDYLVENIKIQESNIIVMGKSLGSGPACHLASHRNPSCLILLTPYTSIAECARDLIGSLSMYLIKDRFRNID